MPNIYNYKSPKITESSAHLPVSYRVEWSVNIAKKWELNYDTTIQLQVSNNEQTMQLLNTNMNINKQFITAII